MMSGRGRPDSPDDPINKPLSRAVIKEIDGLLGNCPQGDGPAQASFEVGQCRYIYTVMRFGWCGPPDVRAIAAMVFNVLEPGKPVIWRIRPEISRGDRFGGEIYCRFAQVPDHKTFDAACAMAHEQRLDQGRVKA